MPLEYLKPVVDRAYAENWAVPAFNFWTVDNAVATVNAAAELKSPVILMASGSCVKHLGLDLISASVAKIAARVDIPVVLHLDHASDKSLIYRAIHSGFTSVMYDGSQLPFAENAANTQEVVNYAQAVGVSVEAELGSIGRGEEGEEQEAIFTEPDEAVKFIEMTKVDALAVAVGTCHGMQKQEAPIRHDIVKALSAVTTVPLVLHGSSGVTDDDLLVLQKTGLSKINFGTRLKYAFVEGAYTFLQDHPGTSNHVGAIESGMACQAEIVRQKIKLVGSENRA